MSEENSKNPMSVILKLIVSGHSLNNLLNSYSTTHSGKKFVNAILLIPIIVPTAVTASLIGCTFLPLDAMSAKDSDSKLSKIVKVTARFLIYIAAAVILIPCIILNLVISLVPFLIFWAMNKNLINNFHNIFKSIVENNQAPTVHSNSDKEHDDLFNVLGSNEKSKDDLEETQSQALVNYDKKLTIERERCGPNETVTISNINCDVLNCSMRNSAMKMRITEGDSEMAIQGVIYGDLPGFRTEGYAAAFDFSSIGVPTNGNFDFMLESSGRFGRNVPEALQELRTTPLVQSMLRNNDGILSIEQPGSLKHSCANVAASKAKV
jgi:hypothetical protein